MARSSDVIDLRGIAALLHISPHTPNQWRQRSRAGLMHPPLPDPDFPDLEHPAWRTQTIINWAMDTGRWPPGAASRSATRKPAAPAAPAAPTKKPPSKQAKKPSKTAVKASAKATNAAAKPIKAATKQTKVVKKTPPPPPLVPPPPPKTEPPKPRRKPAPPVVFKPPPEEEGRH